MGSGRRLLRLAPRRAKPARVQGRQKGARTGPRFPTFCGVARDRPGGDGSIRHAILRGRDGRKRLGLPENGLPIEEESPWIHKNCTHARQKRARSHTASRLYSPVFLRCGRSHSGEEPKQNSTDWVVLVLTLRERGERDTRMSVQISSCWARISRLKAMRRSSTTTAKLAQPASSCSVHSRREGISRAMLFCTRLRIS